MKLLIMIITCTMAVFAQSPLQVDTSVKDIKPKPQVKKFDPEHSAGYKPSFPMKASFGRKYDEKSEFEKEQQENMDTSARNTSP